MPHDPSGLMISGSYLINGVLLLGIAQVWRTATASKKTLHDRIDAQGASLGMAHTEIAVLKANHEHMTGDLTEIRKDVKELLQRIPAKSQ